MREDLYPSRVSEKPQIIPRKDPVVYAQVSKQPPVSQDDMLFFQKNGFLIKRELFSPAEVNLLAAELQAVSHSEHIRDSELTIKELGSESVRSVFQIHHLGEIFPSVSCDSRILNFAEAVLGSPVYIHQSRANFKPGFRGKEFYWHSDFETWHVEDGMPRMRALSCSITLTDNYHCNGPLMLIPGSHRHFISCVGQTPEENYKKSLKKQDYGVPDDESLTHFCAEAGIEEATGPAGTVVFFDCNTMHGSNGNITPHPRSNLFFVFNSIHNKLVDPFCEQPPRPEHIAARERTEELEAAQTDYAALQRFAC